jgi:hypothetical protein
MLHRRHSQILLSLRQDDLVARQERSWHILGISDRVSVRYRSAYSRVTATWFVHYLVRILSNMASPHIQATQLVHDTLYNLTGLGFCGPVGQRLPRCTLAYRRKTVCGLSVTHYRHTYLASGMSTEKRPWTFAAAECANCRSPDLFALLDEYGMVQPAYINQGHHGSLL